MVLMRIQFQSMITLTRAILFKPICVARTSTGENVKLKRTRFSSHFYGGCRYVSNASSYDPYKVLNVEPGASLDDIRTSYLKLSKKYHPDYNPGDEDAEEQFILVTGAYRKLIEKIESEQSKRNDEDHTDGEERVEKKYDFTISPLGIETENPKGVDISAGFRKFLFAILLLSLFMYLQQNYGLLVQSNIKKTIHQRKSEAKKETEASERIRQAIIEEHKKHVAIAKEFKRASGQ